MSGKEWRCSWILFTVAVYLVGFEINSKYFSVSAMNKMPPPEAKLYPEFSRQCSQSKDKSNSCKFTSPDSPGNSLYFKCRENDICFCARGTAPADVLVWSVAWEVDTQKCLVGKGGPCGNDNGISVYCMSGLDCIQGRCRNSSEIHNGQVNQFCNDDIDCRPGLACHEPGQKMEIRIKRCFSV